MLMVFSFGSIIATALPDTTHAMLTRFQGTDSVIAESVAGPERELVMALENLSGTAPVPVRLYDKKGASLWWCREASSSASGFRCFSRQGIDPVTASSRLPLSKDMVSKAIRNLNATATSKNADLQAQRSLQDKQIKDLEEKQRITARNRLVNIPSTPAAALLNIEEDGRFSPAVTKHVEKTLGISSNAVFLRAAHDEGVVSRIRQGNPQYLRSLNLDLAARTLVLGTVVQRFVPNESLAKAGRAEIELDLVAIDTKSTEAIWRDRIDVSVLGHNQRLATELAHSALSSRVQDALGPVLSRRP